jgi:hypothetical protein
MAGVYSTRFIALDASAAENAYYTVPDGYVAVIRDVTCYVSPGAGNSCYVGLITPLAGILNVGGQADAIVTETLQCRVVLNAGDEIQATVIADEGCSILVSGYLLAA